MSNSDPMFRDFIIAIRRSLKFIALSSIIFVVVWTLTLLLKLNVDFRNLPIWWNSGWKSSPGIHLPQVLFYGCWLTGLQTTAIFYLVIWVRWLKRGNINGYERGAQIDQGRM